MPVRANSPTKSESMMMIAPAVVNPEAEIVEEGKETSRAPICSGRRSSSAPSRRASHEEDHDDPVCGEDLVIMMRRQVAFRAAEGHALLQSRIMIASENPRSQHHQRRG